MSVYQGLQTPARRRILVVDDEPQIRDMITRALEAVGYEIDTAADGAAGLRLALADDYHLVILDLVMPVADGRQVRPGSGASARTSPCSRCPACPMS